MHQPAYDEPKHATPAHTPWLRGERSSPHEPRLLIWQGLSAALFVLWVFTFAFMHFSSQLSSWQSLGVLKGELASAVQQLAQQQQTLVQRLQALEQAKSKE